MANKKEYKFVRAYGKRDYDKDEKSFNNSIENGKPIDWNAFSRLMTRDLALNTNILETGYIGNIHLNDACKAMENPKANWQMLLEISNQLMHDSPHYYRMNNLYSNMALFCWGIDLYDVKDNANTDAIKKQYNSLAARLENMQLKHEFSKVMKYLPYQDVYCGLIVESSTDFFFQKLDLRICKIHQIQDGLYNFKINLGSINAKDINAYPDYVRNAYIDYIEGRVKSNWYTPPADKQICVKLNSQWVYPYPILISLVRDILDLDIYKKLKLKSAKTDNYKAIMVKVPIDENSVDKPLLTPETLGIFAEINRESMDDDIGLIHTLGSDGEAISFKDSSNTRNNVSDAVDEIYNSAGITKEMFNGSSSGTAVTFSVENDSAFVYNLYRQFERWVNRYIKIRKYNKPAFKFHFWLLDITVFNRDTVSDRYKNAISFGTPVIDKYLASLDMTPSRIFGSFVLHQEVYKFNENFIPLQTSYNSSVQDSSNGRPKSKSSELSESGEDTRDKEKNDR